MKTIKFAENLRVLRLSRNMTQQQLAALTWLDRRTVSAWGKGVCETSFSTLARLCEIFEESFDGILS